MIQSVFGKVLNRLGEAYKRRSDVREKGRKKGGYHSSYIVRNNPHEGVESPTFARNVARSLAAGGDTMRAAAAAATAMSPQATAQATAPAMMLLFKQFQSMMGSQLKLLGTSTGMCMCPCMTIVYLLH